MTKFRFAYLLLQLKLLLNRRMTLLILSSYYYILKSNLWFLGINWTCSRYNVYFIRDIFIGFKIFRIYFSYHFQILFHGPIENLILPFLRFWHTDLISRVFTLIGLVLSFIENLNQLGNKMKRQGHLLADVSRITSDLARLKR